MAQYKKGDKIQGFRIESVEDLKEFRSTGYYLIHEKTGCQLVKLACEDTEKMFLFSFRTPPKDNTGVAHILEHSVLCGSEKFPVKDPFLAMMKGSMNTFLNAMTFPDRTLYPAASTVKKDYFNLMQVYGDAVFFPLLTEECFMQEGHHLEIEDGAFKQTGVVYNEMKGNYSSEEGIAADWSYKSLFPDNPYGFDSGGDPDFIPELKYQDFKQFHKDYYHPSNGKIVLYGDVPLEEELEFLDREYLSRFEKREISSEISLQKPFLKPISKTVYWPSNQEDNPVGTITESWVCSQKQDPVLILSFEILEEILIGTPGSPLQKALADADFGQDMSPISGIETELLQLIFTIGMRGLLPADKGRFEDLIAKVLTDLVKNGINKELILASVRKVEFQNREITGGSPFGLTLAREIFRGWNYHDDPWRTLYFERYMKEIQERLEKTPDYFEQLISRWLLENNHRSTIITVPDAHLAEKKDKDLEEKLAGIYSECSKDQLQNFVEAQDRLRVFQEAPDDPSVKLPLLKKSDIPVKVKNISFENRSIAGVKAQVQNGFTNGIIYLDLAFSLEELPKSYFLYLPLFCQAVSGTGLPGISYEEVYKQINLNSGGMGLRLESGETLSHDVASMIIARTKMLESQIPEGMDLFLSLLKEADFSNVNRIEQMIQKMRNQLKAGLIPSGSNHAVLRSGCQFSESFRIDEGWRSISQLNFLNKLLDDISKDKSVLGEISQVFSYIRSILLKPENLTINLTGEENGVELCIDYLEKVNLFTDNPSLEPPSCIEFAPYLHKDPMEGLVVPSSVNYLALSFLSEPYGSTAYAHQTVLCHILKTGPFWETIRMKGGAYGAFTSFSALEGVLSFASFRDPEIENTLEAFKACLVSMGEQTLSLEEFDTALVGLIGTELRPLTPSDKSIIAYRREVYGIKDEMRQAKREAVLAMTPEDLKVIAKKTLKALNTSSVTIVGGKGALDKASQAIPILKGSLYSVEL